MELFAKSLKKTDVGSRLSIPSKCLKKLPNFAGENTSIDLEVRDINGSFWRFRCSIRRQSYAKPVLSGDWKRFATTKALSIGDEIKLFKENDQALHYRVEVKKVVNFRLFGTTFCVREPPRVL